MGTRLNRLNEAVLTCTHDLSLKQKYEIYHFFYLKIIVFTAVKYCSMIHKRVIVIKVREKQ